MTPETRRWYHTKAWERRRRHQLREHPLCVMCLGRGELTPAEIADHVTPHADDINLFLRGRLQSLCAPCHNKLKQQVDRNGHHNAIGADGFPLDPRHPFYRDKS